MRAGDLALRWTVGDVSDRGFQALRLSVWGAWRLFGPEAAYAVCVNTVPADSARARAGLLPPGIAWHVAERSSIPAVLAAHLDDEMAEGVAWKFAPPRLFPDRFELSLDNDCLLWGLPRAIADWLEAPEPRPCLLAEDVVACFGQFAALCGTAPRNTGIRGLPPGFDLAAALGAVLAEYPGPLDSKLLASKRLASELDEQGLQVAALSRARPALVVPLADVAICSPFPPHAASIGRCGAHFVGLNMRTPRPQHGCTQPSLDALAAFWDARRVELTGLAGAPAIPVR